ncbi:protein NDR1-like [Arachis stenosperma]|uniref:protein NDR1-like n=1 Tax=Arachis stenosperma TaxID=217475 RepID=UPI0025ABEDD6|nr:protein NDR1-like [Arachis stenosperma]
MAEQHSCCSCCFSFIITMGLTALFFWLSLRVDQPKFYLESIYVPALNRSLPSTTKNDTVLFKIKFTNPNKDKGIKYDAVRVNISVFLSQNTTRLLSNSTAVAPFYQGRQKKAHKPSSASFVGNLTPAAGMDGKVYFRVDFATAVKYKILFWYTKRHGMWGGANVEINNGGVKVYPKPVRLGNEPPRIVNGAPEFRGGYRALLPLFLVAWIMRTH